MRTALFLSILALTVTTATGAAPPSAGVSTSPIVVDFARAQGAIRPLHGVNGGPLNFQEMFDLTKYWQEVGIPVTRLHDCHWPAQDVVDIPAIFPLFHLDPDKAENYLFARTDDYINGIVKTGARIVYRLGPSIQHTKRKYDTHPPADFDKWARACVNVIRHYNEGWAGGFRHDIRYWEIWNEPNVGASMWTGTPEEYFRLYETAARAIKQHNPQLKVGGPAMAGSGGAFREKFLAFCRQRNAPLDFFSWHTYTSDPAVLARNAQQVRAALDRHDFKDTESHLNEWHYAVSDVWKRRKDPLEAKTLFEQINGPEGAAFAASALILLQDSPVDVANYYTGDTLRWGLFANYGIPNKCYHAFKAFRRLLDTPRRVACNVDGATSQVAVCAGLSDDDQAATVLLSNHRSPASAFALRIEHLPWPGRTVVETFALDESRDLDRLGREECPAGALSLLLDCPKPSIRLLRLTPAP